jgi:hypothetical protein
VIRVICNSRSGRYVRRIMFERKKNRTLPYTLLFIAGAVAGAAVALLVTPAKLQKKLKSAVEDQVDNVEQLVRRVVNA